MVNLKASNIRTILVLLLLVIVITTPISAQDTQDLKKIYNEAAQHYIKLQLDKAKTLINSLLSQLPSSESIDLGDGYISNIEPFALDMLGRIYLAEGNTENAKEIFWKMLDSYPNDVIFSPYDNETTYTGPAGAVALSCLINISLGATDTNGDKRDSAIHSCTPTETIKPDLKKAMNLSYDLLRGFQGTRSDTYAGDFTWEGSAAWTIIDILQRSNLPVSRREEEVRKINKILKNERLKVELLMELGDIYRRSGHPKQAIRIFREVISTYPYVFYVNEEADVEFILYSLEAYQRMIYTMKQYKYSEENKKLVSQEMRSHYDKFINFLKNDYKVEYAEHYALIFKSVYGDNLD